MANLNKVFLIGRLARDPELRYIPSGTAVTTFTVATNRAYTMASGEKREETCFVRVVAWARQAELCGEYLSKGSPVFVEGRLQSRNWGRKGWPSCRPSLGNSWPARAAGSWRLFTWLKEN